MKKQICRLLCLCVIVALMVPANAQDLQNQEIALSDEAHVYSVLPGTEEWNNMEPEERYAACSVSKAEVENMTTEALVETVMNYPYLINIYAYDTFSLGIDEVSKYFPGLQELFSRNDATEVLEKYVTERARVLSADEVDLNAYDAQSLMCYISQVKPQTATSFVYDTVDTPNGSAVDVIVDMSWNDVSDYFGVWPPITFDIALAQSEELERTYPSASLYRDPAPNYNCHSYAWYSTSSSNEYWMEDPSPYITDGSYEGHTAAVGCKVTYRSNRIYTHSGNIVATPGGPVTVRSKWGALGVFTHDVDDCPYVGTGESVTVSSWARA